MWKLGFSPHIPPQPQQWRHSQTFASNSLQVALTIKVCELDMPWVFEALHIVKMISKEKDDNYVGSICLSFCNTFLCSPSSTVIECQCNININVNIQWEIVAELPPIHVPAQGPQQCLVQLPMFTTLPLRL